MEGTEIRALKDLKTELLKKAKDLLKELKEQEANGSKPSLEFNLPPSDTRESHTVLEQELFDKDESELCKFSCQVSRISFENVEKKWLHDNLYRYTADLVTKAIRFPVQLTVDVQGKEFEISNITCIYNNTEQCYMQELQLCVNKFTQEKNFSLLTSVLSQYSEQCILRSKFLDDMKVQGYVKIELSNNGGIILHVHSRKNPQKLYLKFQWTLIFSEKICRFDHFFKIHPTNMGIKFVENNQSLLNAFCKKGIKKNKLLELWSKLYSSIDNYETVQESETHTSVD